MGWVGPSWIADCFTGRPPPRPLTCSFDLQHNVRMCLCVWVRMLSTNTHTQTRDENGKIPIVQENGIWEVRCRVGLPLHFFLFHLPCLVCCFMVLAQSATPNSLPHTWSEDGGGGAVWLLVGVTMESGRTRNKLNHFISLEWTAEWMVFCYLLQLHTRIALKL